MPWEVTIRRSDHSSLGDREEVRGQIIASLPGIRFYREPSGADKIAAARATGVEFPDIIRRHLEQRPAVERAEFRGEGFSVLLYGFECQPLLVVHAEVRGDGNPVPVLAALCCPNGWVAIDDTSRQPVDLKRDSAAGWEAFRQYRDGAIQASQAKDHGG